MSKLIGNKLINDCISIDLYYALIDELESIFLWVEDDTAKQEINLLQKKLAYIVGK